MTPGKKPTPMCQISMALLPPRTYPRIRNFPSKRLYIFDPNGVPKELKGLIGGKIREGTILTNGPDILRSAATMVAGAIPPSQLLRKFSAQTRQHDLAIALREIGRVEERSSSLIGCLMLTCRDVRK